jgi:hypothetical protein
MLLPRTWPYPNRLLGADVLDHRKAGPTKTTYGTRCADNKDEMRNLKGLKGILDH